MTQTIVRVGHSYDGPLIGASVSDLLKSPTRLPNILIQAVKDNTLADLLLRKGPIASGGSIAYEEQVIFSSDRSAEIIAEFAAIPTTQSGATLPMVMGTQKRGLGLKISKEMERRNDVGRVAFEINLVKEEMVNAWNKVFYAAVYQNPNTLTRTATNAGQGGWFDTDQSMSKIRRDVAQSLLQMANQTVQGAQNNDKYGFKPDTMIVHPTVSAELIDNEEINRVYMNSPATTLSPRFLMRMPNQFIPGLDWIESWECNPDQVIFCKRGTMGFISNEWDMEGSPMEYKASEETWSSYFTRRAAVGIDHPKSVLVLSGISS